MKKEFVDFAVLLEYRVKIRESKNLDKKLDLARKLKKLLNMKVTIIPIWTSPQKAWKKDWRNWKSKEELLRIVIILRRFQEK